MPLVIKYTMLAHMTSSTQDPFTIKRNYHAETHTRKSVYVVVLAHTH